MKNKILFTIIKKASAVLLATLLAGAGANASAQDTSALVSSNTALALDLYGRLGADGGNFFFSPYSISTCLAMTYAGARGATAQQMAQALHFSTNQDELAAGFGAWQRQAEDLQTQGGIEFKIANGLWAQQDKAFLPAFVNNATNNFEAMLQQVDFPKDAEPVRLEINQWVSGKTKGLIPNLLPPGFVKPTTRLVLANAIYFKGAWATQFNSNLTTVEPFQLSASQTINAPLMHQAITARYGQNDLLQAVEIPYRDSSLSMLILLPRAVDGISQLEASLTPAALAGWMQGMFFQQVNLTLPKFKFDAAFSLVQPLQEMGMLDAFSGAADFSAIDGDRDLVISGVAHKAYVDVSEEGTEAAAATGTGFTSLATAWSSPPPVFRADHPFIFLIRDSISGGVYFMGRLANPADGPVPPPAPVTAPRVNPSGFAYEGLFFNPDAVTVNSSGSFTFTVSRSRLISGKLIFTERAYLFSGKLDAETGSATLVIKRPIQSNLTLTLQISPSGDVVTGTISDGTWTSQLAGNKSSGVFTATHRAPTAGDYTMTLLGDSDGATSPGYGTYGRVTVAPNGTITLVGLLSDGQIIHQSSALSADGKWPLFIPLYAGKGSLLGWIDFTNQPASRFNGSVSWIKTGANGPYYNAGFTNVATMLGSAVHR